MLTVKAALAARPGPWCTPVIERADWALLLGGADCLWDDVGLVLDLIAGPWPGLVIACNDAGVHWPDRLDHLVSLHWDKFFAPARDGSGDWVRKREAHGHPGGYLVWTRPLGGRGPKAVEARRFLAERGVGYVEQWGPGSSGYLTVAVAREVIARPIPRAIACGMPMEETPHFFGGKYWRHAMRHRRAWARDIPRLGWVRSMSGWTMKRLGRPDLTWLED